MADDELIRRYNCGNLPAHEAQAFEVRMINEPALAREVELDALLESGARANAMASGERRSPATWARHAGLGLAAAALGLAVGLISRPSMPAWSGVAFAELGELRGLQDVSPATQLHVNSATAVVLEMPALRGELMQVVSIEGGGVDLNANAESRAGVVSLALAPGTLRAGSYRVWVHAGDRKGPVYPLEVTSVR